ncbi:hypothetical protein [Nocardia sp. NPDC004604]|uniref:hypothetical protein n=1 Tax=Nocardia sp. NPDC004604 TaxID=3157013 RepID=UPI0033B80396
MLVMMAVVFVLAGAVLVQFYPIAAAVAFAVAAALVGVSLVRFLRQRRRAELWTASARTRGAAAAGGVGLSSYINGGGCSGSDSGSGDSGCGGGGGCSGGGCGGSGCGGS